MKKVYVTPKAEVIKFDYTETVVASSPTSQSGAKCPNPCGGGNSGGFKPTFMIGRCWF